MRPTKREPYRKTGPVNLSHEPEKPEPFYIDETKLRYSCEVHQDSLRWLATICEDFKKLKFGNITKEILGTIMSGSLSEIQQKFYARIDSNLQKTGIDDEFILSNYRAGTATPLTSFEDSVKYNLNMVDVCKGHYRHAGGFEASANNYTITEDGQLTFTDSDRERLKAGCSVYLNSDAQRQFVKQVESVLAGMDELKRILERNGLKYPLFGEVFLTDSVTGSIKLNKEFIKYIVK